MNRRIIQVYRHIYTIFYELVISSISAQRAHEAMIGSLRSLDDKPLAIKLAQRMRKSLLPGQAIEVAGISLSQGLVMAAGLVKGDGFHSEDEALRAVHQTRRNIIPGWRFIPALLGPVEFGSFTRYPRMGNLGQVLWRDETTRSTQNRVGLKNPGARAAAEFLAKHKARLPSEFGINIAVSPSLQGIERQEQEIVESLLCFLDCGVLPTWFTLNLSCPNTEDDPLGYQLEAHTRRLCAAFINCLEERALAIPLWVKISPGLAREQYHALVQIFKDVGVKAIVATNTLPKPSPANPEQIAGLGGGDLFDSALGAVKLLRQEIVRSNAALDIVACGGILDGASYQAYRECGVKVAQYWSALVYRGPFAAAIIASELADNEYNYQAAHSESLA